MKSKLLLLAGLCSPLLTFAQPTTNKTGSRYHFTPIKVLEALPVQDQAASNTCWSFSSLSFLEAEMKRAGKNPVKLSEMYVVNKAYKDKVNYYVRSHGNNTLAAGGAFHDMTYVWKNYGLVPQSVYPSLRNDDKRINHFELDAVMPAFGKALVAEADKKGKLSAHWQSAVAGIVDAYLGTAPDDFKYEGKSYTPATFAQSLGLDPNDYIEIGSYSHHPFYSSFVLEIPDNWQHEKIYNVPLNEFMDIIDQAIMKGYSVAWGADVSEKGFSGKNGLAIIPDKDWADISTAEKDTIFNSPIKEKYISQELRQLAFDNYETQDDHGMHIIGMYKDQNNEKFYLVKNSWGEKSNDCGGYVFVSAPYVRYKTTSIMLHKKALSAGISQKLNVK